MKSLQRNCTEFKVKSFSWKKRRVISRDGRVDVHLEGVGFDKERKHERVDDDDDDDIHLEGGVGLDKEGEHERVEGEEV